MIANALRARVFVDLAPLAPDGSNGGAARFVRALLARLAPRHELHLLVKPETAEAVAGLVAAGAVVHRLGTGIREPRRLRRTLRRLPLARLFPDAASLRRLGAEVLFSPLQTATFHEPRLRHVAIAYDFQELAHPEFFTPEERARRAAFRADLRSCDRVVAISSFTRDEAVSLAGIAPERVEVLPPVVSRREPLDEADAAARVAALGLARGGYALYPANFWPHKNHGALLEAVARAPGVHLVLCGALAAGRSAAAARASELGVTDRVTILPHVGDDDLTALLQGARLLAFPSRFEGFGIPVLEAFGLGIPVACSRIPALEELAGDGARFFNPEDPRSIASALEALWGDAELRARLAAAGCARSAAVDPVAALERWVELLGAGPTSERTPRA